MRIPLLLLAMTMSVVAIGRPLQEDTVGTRIDQIVRFQVDNNKFSGSVLVAKEDRILFSKGYGFANIESKIPNSPTTKHRIGSLTKQFTAAAILLLEEEGKLKIDAPVRASWPEAPAAWGQAHSVSPPDAHIGNHRYRSLPIRQFEVIRRTY